MELDSNYIYCSWQRQTFTQKWSLVSQKHFVSNTETHFSIGIFHSKKKHTDSKNTEALDIRQNCIFKEADIAGQKGICVQKRILSHIVFYKQWDVERKVKKKDIEKFNPFLDQFWYILGHFTTPFSSSRHFTNGFKNSQKRGRH